MQFGTAGRIINLNFNLAVTVHRGDMFVQSASAFAFSEMQQQPALN